MARHPKPYSLQRRADSPYWWVRFPDGHRESLEIELGDRPAAEREAAARFLARGGDPGKRRAAEANKLVELPKLIELFVADVEAKYTGKDKRHVDRIEGDLVYHVEAYVSDVRKITGDWWDEHKVKLHHSREGGRLKWRSIAHLGQTLRRFLRWCHKRGLLETVPELTPPSSVDQKADSAPRKAMSEEQVHAFIAALRQLGEDRAARIYTVLFESWQRKSTIEALTLRWIDWKAETITIPAEHFKTRREKLIDLTPECAAAIRQELAERGTISLDESIFGRFDFHQEWDAERKGGVFGRALVLAGIDPYGLTPHHVTRHSAASIAGGRPGASLAGLMAQAGGDSAAMAERYLHPSLKDARRLTRQKG